VADGKIAHRVSLQAFPGPLAGWSENQKKICWKPTADKAATRPTKDIARTKKVETQAEAT